MSDLSQSEYGPRLYREAMQEAMERGALDASRSSEAIERAAKALYDAMGKQHGGYEPGPRKGVMTYRAFEWEELSEEDKGGVRSHARAVLNATSEDSR